VNINIGTIGIPNRNGRIYMGISNVGYGDISEPPASSVWKYNKIRGGFDQNYEGDWIYKDGAFNKLNDLDSEEYELD
jgi:hypothetical protein